MIMQIFHIQGLFSSSIHYFRERSDTYFFCGFRDAKYTFNLLSKQLSNIELESLDDYDFIHSLMNLTVH